MKTIKERYQAIIPAFEEIINNYDDKLPSELDYSNAHHEDSLILMHGWKLTYSFSHTSAGEEIVNVIISHRMTNTSYFTIKRNNEIEDHKYWSGFSSLHDELEKSKFRASDRLRLINTNFGINNTLDTLALKKHLHLGFFWENSSPFSQWYKKQFQAQGLSFNSAEQYMMFNKALLFEDEEIAGKILETSNVRKQKELGRNIINFDQKVWEENARRIVYEGNYHKFNQNQDIKEILISTNNKLLVEAAPNDTIWGIGLSANDKMALDKPNWKGTNWLGYILTQLRDDFNLTKM